VGYERNHGEHSITSGRVSYHHYPIRQRKKREIKDEHTIEMDRKSVVTVNALSKINETGKAKSTPKEP